MTIRHNWTVTETENLFLLPFHELLHSAHTMHLAHFNPNTIQKSTLMSIKTGGCPEDCAYCSQSAHHKTELQREPLKPLAEVVEKAKQAKACGATRFCMGAAWRHPKAKDLEQVLEMVKAIKTLGMETCVTLGMLTPVQAHALKAAGLDYYNHNLDTSPSFYEKIITTRTYEDRLKTLQAVREAALKVCCGGIIGMGETRRDRCELLVQLANLPEHPHSVPINHLVPVSGTPLVDAPPLEDLEFIRTIAITRLMMPASVVRLSAGRECMSDLLQAICFFAGANSIFYGEQLLTTPNQNLDKDIKLFQKLGLPF